MDYIERLIKLSNFIKVKNKVVNLDCVDFIWEDDYSLDNVHYFELGFSFVNDSVITILFDSKEDRKNVVNSFDYTNLISVDTYIINTDKISYVEKLTDKLIIWFISGDNIHIEGSDFSNFNL